MPVIKCQNCGSESADEYYKDKQTGEIIGCSECLKAVSYEDLQQEEEFNVWLDIETHALLERRHGIA